MVSSARTTTVSSVRRSRALAEGGHRGEQEAHQGRAGSDDAAEERAREGGRPQRGPARRGGGGCRGCGA